MYFALCLQSSVYMYMPNIQIRFLAREYLKHENCSMCFLRHAYIHLYTCTCIIDVETDATSQRKRKEKARVSHT